MFKSIGEFVLVCLVLQMVVFVQLNKSPGPDEPPKTAGPQRYRPRSLAESHDRKWSAEYALQHERFPTVKSRPHHSVAQHGSLQNVSLPLTELPVNRKSER